MRKELAELLTSVRNRVDSSFQPIVQIFSKIRMGLRRADCKINVFRHFNIIL